MADVWNGGVSLCEVMMVVMGISFFSLVVVAMEILVALGKGSLLPTTEARTKVAVRSHTERG